MQLVRTLAAQPDLHAGSHGLEERLEEHHGGVEVLTVPHQVGKVPIKIACIEQVLMMLQVQGGSDGFGRLPVWVVLASGHGPYLRHGLAGSLGSLVGHRRNQG